MGARCWLALSCCSGCNLIFVRIIAALTVLKHVDVLDGPVEQGRKRSLQRLAERHQRILDAEHVQKRNNPSGLVRQQMVPYGRYSVLNFF